MKKLFYFTALFMFVVLTGCPAPEAEDSGASLCDRDGDGFKNIICGGDDCNDDDADIHPDAKEMCD